MGDHIRLTVMLNEVALYSMSIVPRECPGKGLQEKLLSWTVAKRQMPTKNLISHGLKVLATSGTFSLTEVDWKVTAQQKAVQTAQ